MVEQMEKGWREEVGLVTGSLRKKLVNFYEDAVDGYDDTTDCSVWWVVYRSIIR